MVNWNVNSCTPGGKIQALVTDAENAGANTFNLVCFDEVVGFFSLKRLYPGEEPGADSEQTTWNGR